MHYCPECGQACDCGGDLDDCEMPDGEERCLCPCDEREYDDDYDDYDGAHISPGIPEDHPTAPTRGRTEEGE